MIWVLSFFFCLLSSIKATSFFSEILDLNSCSLLMASISPLIMFIINVSLYSSLSSNEHKFFSKLFCLIIFLVSLSFFVSSLFLFLLLVELCVWPMSFLLLNMAKDLDKFISLIYMIYINIFGSVPFMIFSSTQVSPTFFLHSVFSCSEFIFSVIFSIFFLMMLISKIPVFFLHFWLTKAHVSASGATSMLLASLMLKLGTFGLFKFHKTFMVVLQKYLPFLSVWSVWGSILVVGIMFRSLDVKFLIACSSILHMSSLLPSTCFGSSISLSGSLFMGVSHGLVSYILFYLVSILYENSVNRSWEFNCSLESVSKFLMMFFFIFLFLNLGIPPFMNFLSELYLFSFFLMYSSFSVVLFGVSICLSVIFTMIFIIKLIFGSSSKILIKFTSLDIYLEFFLFTFSLMLLPFFC